MEDRKKATRMRQVIAKNMVASWTNAPKCDFVMEIDAVPIIEFRKKLDNDHGCKISFLSMVMKAAATAMVDFPVINTKFDFETMEHISNEAINIGFAMAMGNGLIVLNVKNTDKKSIADITEENRALIEKAEGKKLTMEDMTGSSMTINNMGAYSRLEHHTAIINQPELCILSIYCIKERPIVKDGEFVIRKTMKLALSADHRVIDGKLACEFLDRVCYILENPEEFIS